jgi:hypothetical protein
MFHPRVHQLVLEEGNSPTNDLLSIHHRRLRRLHILVRLPPLAPRQDLLARVLLQSPLASSVVRLSTTPMLVRRGTSTHPLETMIKASNRLRLSARDLALLESTKSVLMLLLMVLILLLVRFILIQFLHLYYLILEQHIRSFLLAMSTQMSYNFKIRKNP